MVLTFKLKHGIIKLHQEIPEREQPPADGIDLNLDNKRLFLDSGWLVRKDDLNVISRKLQAW